MSYNEHIEKLIASALNASPWHSNDNTTEAYLEGARMVAELLKMNPHLINETSEERDIRLTLLCPSRINYTSI